MNAPTQNQLTDKKIANASQKLKEVHPHAQSQRDAAHLLLPQRTVRQLSRFDRITGIKKLTLTIKKFEIHRK